MGKVCRLHLSHQVPEKESPPNIRGWRDKTRRNVLGIRSPQQMPSGYQLPGREDVSVWRKTRRNTRRSLLLYQEGNMVYGRRYGIPDRFCLFLFPPAAAPPAVWSPDSELNLTFTAESWAHYLWKVSSYSTFRSRLAITVTAFIAPNAVLSSTLYYTSLNTKSALDPGPRCAITTVEHLQVILFPVLLVRTCSGSPASQGKGNLSLVPIPRPRGGLLT